jgi:hypothetical protein
MTQQMMILRMSSPECWRRVICAAILLSGLAGNPINAFAQDEKPKAKPKVRIILLQPEEQPVDPPKPRPLPQPLPSPGPLPPSPIPQPGPRPDPAPPGTGLAGSVLRGKLGSEGFRDFVDQLSRPAPSGCGRNFRCQDPWFDRAAPPRADTPVVRPQGQEFLRGGFTPPSRNESRGTLDKYGGQPGGGVVLEDTATGLASISELGYDRQFNALVFDGRAVYFIRIPPGIFAELCRALARDDRVGVSLGQRRLVYGAVPRSSDLALDLTLADRFLGDIVFARDDWAAGYRFAGGYAPRAQTGPVSDIAVFFRFRGYGFELRGNEVVPTRGRVDVSLVPLSRQTAADGNLMPDFDAIDAGNLPAQYEANARHLADNMPHYRREQIVQRTFVYGEVAALLRRLRSEGVDLEELAAQVR